MGTLTRPADREHMSEGQTVGPHKRVLWSLFGGRQATGFREVGTSMDLAVGSCDLNRQMLSLRQR